MKKQKRICYLAVLILMIGAWVLPVLPVKAEETPYSGSCGADGADITWTFDYGTNALTLTGSGAMEDYYYDSSQGPSTIAPWFKYQHNITEINIDDNITYIGSSAFYGLYKVTGTLHLPDKLEGIGKYAFYYCNWFEPELAFPETLETIGDSAFAYFASTNIPDKPSLTLTFPKSVTSVGANAFERYSDGVKSVYIKNAAMEMGENCLGDSKTPKLYGAAGSTAEAYAAGHDLEFFIWDGNSTEYTVTFDSNGGSAVAPQKIQIGDKAKEPTTPVKEGYYFEGWFLGEERFDFREAVHGDITLTARWAELTITGDAPVLTLRNQSDWSVEDIVLKWDACDDRGLLRYEIYRALGEDGEYKRIGTAEAWENTYTDDVGMNYERTKYHYKIRAIYEGEMATSFSNAVSTKGIMCGSPENLDKNCVDVKLTDAEGNVLDKLTLHVGESSPELHLQLTYKNGTKRDFKDICYEINKKQGWGAPFISWDVSRNSNSDNWDEDDCARFLPTMDYLGINTDTATCTAKLLGEAVTSESTKQYISVTFQDLPEEGGSCVLWIPITVLPAEPGKDYGEVEEIKVFTDKAFTDSDAFWQSVKDSLRNRESSFYVLLDGDVYNQEYGHEMETEYGDTIHYNDDLADDLERRAFDFYAERVGMKSYEGDYLNESIKSWDAQETGIYYEGKFYQSLWFSKVDYFSTKKNEDWMDKEIDKMVNQPGGMFYAYKDKSDYEKVKAVYDYVSNKIKWVDGTKVGIYHMAYSGLHDGKGTCQSYALLFYRLTRELGVPSRVLMGTDAGAHTYNIVKLGSRWYYIDCSNKRFLQGSKSFKTTKLQSIWLTKDFQDNYIKKISPENYGGSKVSSISSITALKSDDIKAIDSNLINTADKMTATYKISGDKITASNTAKTVLAPVYGCSNYLGAEKNTNAAKEQGYFLALRLNVDKSKFADEGRITVSYQPDDEKIEKEYTGSSIKEKGYVDIILKLPEEDQNITITVDFDTSGDDSDYQEKIYSVQTSSLKKQGAEKFGALKEITDLNSSCGIETSAPKIKTENSGEKITVVYDSVAYSKNVTLPEKDVAEGYYIALQAAAPEAMKGTAALENVSLELESGGKIKAEDFCYKMADDNSIRLFFHIAENTWGDLGTLKVKWTEDDVQEITIQTADECIFETIDSAAQLPKSIKFNGVATTMYTGQTQIADTTVVRNYERDILHLVFTSSDSNIISVNRITGELKALRPGTATVTVTVTDGNGQVTRDKKGNVVKGLFASVKITVKAPTAPGSLKLTEISDTSAVMNWKANTTGQQMEIYAIPVNKEEMGKNKNNWKTAIETALKEEGMDYKLLSSMDDSDVKALCRSLETRFNVNEGSCGIFTASSSDKSLLLEGLQVNTGYAFYVRNIAQSEIGDIYFTGAIIGETKTKTTVLTDVTLIAKKADGSVLESANFGGSKPVITITNGTLADGPVQLAYEESAEGAAYTGVAYKTTNAQVIKVDKNGKLTLGTQAGTAELYVTGKDSAGKVRESGRIQITVRREPNKLANKTTTLALGGSVKLRDLIGYSTKGSSTEIDVAKVDFEAVLDVINETGCFEITGEEGNEADALITAAAFLTDAKGNTKAGNSISIPVNLYAGATHEEGEQAVSTAVATIKVTDMAQPAITKTIPMDRSVTVKFKPNATVREYDGQSYYYTVTISDKATKELVEIPEKNIEFSEESDSTAKAPLYTCVITGLNPEQNYNVQITAHYKTQDEKLSASKDSAVKNFKTLKPLLTNVAEKGQLPINYISLPDLRKNISATGEEITERITLRNNETYVFMAQVSRLNRVLGTDKLKWTISSSTKSIATVKATGDTYQAQLNTLRTGTFTVTVTSTVSKEVLAVFEVTVIPYQSGE